MNQPVITMVLQVIYVIIGLIIIYLLVMLFKKVV